MLKEVGPSWGDGVGGNSPEKQAPDVERVQFGLETLEVERRVINILPQIRSTFDEGKLRELEDAIPEVGIDQDGTACLGLINPPTVALLTPEAADAYLRDFNQFRRENGYSDAQVWTRDDLTPCTTADGVRYVILIAGERRIRAGTEKVRQQYGDGMPAVWSCSVHRDIAFLDALPIQFKENNARANPSPVDEARAIMSYYRSMKRCDNKTTKKWCAQQFGISDKKFRRAEIFVNYPPSMQALADEFKFSLVVDACGIYRLWCEYYEQQQREAKEANQEYELTAGDGATFFASIPEIAAYETKTMLLMLEDGALRRHTEAERPAITIKTLEEAVWRRIQQGDGLFGDGTLLEAVAGIEPGDDESSTPLQRRQLAEGQLAKATEKAMRLLSPGHGQELAKVALRGVPLEDRQALLEQLLKEAEAAAETGGSLPPCYN